MSALRFGYITGSVIGALWLFILATTTSIVVSFASGEAVRPSLWGSLIWGAIIGGALVWTALNRTVLIVVAPVVFALGLIPFGYLASSVDTGDLIQPITALIVAVSFVLSFRIIVWEMPFGDLTRHEFEEAVIRFLTGFGYIVFTIAVVVPFYVMVMTSLKSQQALLKNPLDFSVDLSRGVDLFRSYIELFRDFGFGGYLWTSFYVSVLTVLITLMFSVPGAYAVARLRFKGRAAFSRSILLIYMVPLIVLALPIYIAFSMVGLRNTIPGLILIYPVTTIPVALYMLQGYFRGLPVEVEEAGLMDGLSRLQVIRKITLPLSLPAMVSVSLYVFMIAWNEFLLAFMLLDDPSKFTLTRGVAMLNSSEIPRQHLMAGAVIATVPIMALFLGLERFMTKGLTAGSVKG